MVLIATRPSIFFPFHNISTITISLTVIGACGFLVFLSYLKCFISNIHIGRKTNFPLVVIPISPEHPLWQALSVPLRPLLKKYLPGRLFDLINLSIYGWEFEAKEVPIRQYGKSFLYTTAGALYINIADADVAADILKRTGKELSLPEGGKRIMKQFGSNMMVADGDDWSRQRRLVQSTLTEKIMTTVWEESSRQAREMMAYFFQPTGEEIKAPNSSINNDTITGLKTIAINVLAGAGFGQTRPWKVNTQTKEPPKPGFRLSYIDAVTIAAHNIIVSALIPTWIWKLPFFSEKVQDIGHAIDEFPRHTTYFLDEERAMLRAKEAGDNQAAAEHRSTFISMLARIAEQLEMTDESEKGAAAATAGVPAKGTLTQDEITGNLFIFTAAGYDTTANTMAYAVSLLAAHPQWQGWIREEIDFVLDRQSGSNSTTDSDLAQSLNIASASYNGTFPRLPRLLALMFETLRLFTPLVHIAKASHDWITVSDAQGKTYNIPPQVTVHINSCAIHTDPSFWGEDALTFDPRRWIVARDDRGTNDLESTAAAMNDGLISALGRKETHLGNEAMRVLTSMQKRHFLPWSAGARSCPGIKMSQVEFCCVMLELFSRFEVAATMPPASAAAAGEQKPGGLQEKEKVMEHKVLEDDEEAKKRLEALMQDSQPILTLQMQQPKEVWLRWRRRSAGVKVS